MDNTIDIISIDNDIHQRFLKEEDNLIYYKNKLNELIESSLSGNITDRIISKNIKDEINELQSKIQSLEINEDKNYYIIESTEIINEYKNILKTPIKQSFIGKSTNSNKDKQKLIDKYLLIARKYIDIPIANIKKNVKYILSCDNCTNKHNFNTEDNICICVECGYQQEILQHTVSYRDSDRINITTKYTYDRIVHFKDCINQYQGKQNCTIDQSVYTQLDNEFEKHYLLLGDKNDPKEIRYKNITTDHVHMFLKELGLSKHYENVIYIHYSMTGHKPDDISHLEEVLLSDFVTILDIYDKNFKNKIDRVNFISTQYVLYQLLLKYKHPCKKEHFVMLKTVEKKSFHDNIGKEIFSILGWNHTPLF